MPEQVDDHAASAVSCQDESGVANVHLMLTGVIPSFASWVLNQIYDTSLEFKFVYLDEMASDLVDEARFTSESCICERKVVVSGSR